MYLIILICLYYYYKYHKIKKMLEHPSKNCDSISKYKKIKFILIYQDGDNINECLKSLSQQTIDIKNIIIIGKNIKHSKYRIYNHDFTSKLLEKVIHEHYQNNDIFGIFRCNTIFERNLIEKTMLFFNEYQCGKLYILNNIKSNNIFQVKYNFFDQLNEYSENTNLDFFLNLDYKNQHIYKSFMITKVNNITNCEYCLASNYPCNFHNNITKFVLYPILLIYPSTIFILYLIQLIYQVITVYRYMSYNQILEEDIKYVLIGNFLKFLAKLLPNFNIKSKPIAINLNNYINPKFDLISKNKNGIYYQVKNSNLKIVHLYGDSYQQGFAYGQLCKNDFLKILSIIESIYHNMKPTNKIMQEIYDKNKSMKVCLLSIFKMLRPFINKNHIMMMEGISSGSGLDLDDVIIITLIPELYHQHCMLIATDSVFIRTLDFFFYMENHLLRIYHNENGYSYCELGIPGTIWCITAVSENLLCIGETSSRFKYETNLLGTPFYLYFKEIMMKTKNISQTLEYLEKIKKNNNIFILISNLVENNSILIDSSKMIKYNSGNFNDYLKKYSYNRTNDSNIIFEYSEPGLLNETLLKINDFTIENIKNSIFKLFRTGGNHSMIVNKNYEMFIQVNNKNIPAFDSDIFKFNLKEIFNEKI